MGQTRVLVNERHGVVCLRFIGTVIGDAGLIALRQQWIAKPRTINFPLLIDMRRWAGYVSDDELIHHFRWALQFRQNHDLEISPLPINVYVSARNASGASLVEQLSRYRAQQVIWCDDVKGAWSVVAPGASMPWRVRFFLFAW